MITAEVSLLAGDDPLLPGIRRGLGAVNQVQFAEDVADMSLDGALIVNFKLLKDVVRFYISRRMMCGMGGAMGGGGMGWGGMCGGMIFPEPEVSQNLATLNHFPCRDQVYIVAFLKALSDGFFQR